MCNAMRNGSHTPSHPAIIAAAKALELYGRLCKANLCIDPLSCAMYWEVLFKDRVILSKNCCNKFGDVDDNRKW